MTHVVSGDLQLSPNKTKDSPRAPSITSERKAEQWSNEGDDLQESVTFDVDDFGTGDQNDDDRDTLNELAWELASSTGRLTRCEEDILDLDMPRYVFSIQFNSIQFNSIQCDAMQSNSIQYVVNA